MIGWVELAMINDKLKLDEVRFKAGKKFSKNSYPISLQKTKNAL